MKAKKLLATRISATKLREPSPSAEEWTEILDAALRAPDHGYLRPTRFHLIEGESLSRFAQLWVDEAVRNGESEALAERARSKGLRAPCVLVVSATIVESKKVPALEQILTAGCAAHAVLLGLQARGYGAVWRTGDMARSKDVKAAFGLAPEDELVAFLYVGTPVEEPTDSKRPKASDYLQRW